MKLTNERIAALEERDVEILSPESTLIGDDVSDTAFERGVTIYPSTTIVGSSSRFGAGTSLGKAGGGYFSNVRCGREVELFGGYFDDCVFLDGVTMRGHAEVRGGTLLEEGCEGAHHVGYKMTVMLPWVVAGSLVNFCDALVAGGRSRREHSEIGSTLALYNYSPWGDKAASLFGDVPRGVFMREDPVFVGGQTQIVSPVKVGFGSVIAAGSAVRRDVPDGRLYGESTRGLDQAFDRTTYGAVTPKIRIAAEYVGNLRALIAWYRGARIPAARDDAFLVGLYQAAISMLEKGIAERAKRVGKLLDKLPVSLEQHLAAVESKDDDMSRERRHRRIDEHRLILSRAESIRQAFEEAGQTLADAEDFDPSGALRAVGDAFHASSSDQFVLFVRDQLPVERVAPAREALQGIVDAFTSRVHLTE